MPKDALYCIVTLRNSSKPFFVVVFLVVPFRKCLKVGEKVPWLIKEEPLILQGPVKNLKRAISFAAFEGIFEKKL